MKNKAIWFLLILILIFFCTFNYICNNLAEITASRAEYYYKKNNIEKAQSYFEKAFNLGLNNSAQREIYVNSIINSPLTVEAQEKLVKFLQNPTEDGAKIKVKYFIYDIQREIYRKYPENYITNAVFNQKIMRWGKLPITYEYENAEEIPKYFIKEIDNAFTEWEKATEHQILFERNNNPNIIIKFEPNNPASNDDTKKYVVAYTTPITDLSTLKNMEIVFYLKDPDGKYFTPNQVYNTALHEIVHALGFMGHCNDKNNIMYLTKDSMSVLNDTREDLTEADINTVKLLYKIKPQITNVNETQSEYIPFLVLGEEEEVTNEKIKEAKIYIKKAPNLPAGYISLAEGYVAIKDYTRAIKNLEKALKYANTEEIRGMIYYNLAFTYYSIDKLETAREYLNRSISINDTDEKHYWLGEIYVREGKTQEAIREYSNLIQKNPKNVEYTIALTNIYVINHKYLKARKTLKNFFDNNPNQRNNPRFNPYGIVKMGL